jgi:hypothetical protein
VALEDAGDGLRCPEGEAEADREAWAVRAADLAIPVDALEPRVEVTVPEEIYQVVRAKAEVSAGGDPSGGAIGEYLMSYLNLRYTWIREETGEVIHEDGGEA